MSQTALEAVNAVIDKVKNMSIEIPGLLSNAKTTSDYAWRPAVPPGHTSFSWTGTTGNPGYVLPVDKNAPASTGKSIAKGKKEKRKSDIEAVVETVTQPLFSTLDIRVGKVVEVSRHPDADSLYIEKIDLGEDKPREIVSGLVKFIPEDQFLNSMVLVFANLKPSKLRGVLSQGMVLCASSEDHSIVELIQPPEGSKIGERVGLINSDSNAYPALSSINPKKKKNEWLDVQPDLKTDDACTASYKGEALVTASGPCKVKSLRNSIIS